MESGLIITGWVVITILYLVMHHGYNKLSRVISWNDEDDIGMQLVIGIVYIVINICYFSFTYHAFKYF